MTGRVRAYMIVDALRHLAFGVALLLAPAAFNPLAYGVLWEVAPHWVWVSSLIVGATHLGYAAITGNEIQARLALIMSATVSIMWAASFALIAASTPTLSLPILFAAVAVKDLIICSGPLHAPRPTAPLGDDPWTSRN